MGRFLHILSSDSRTKLRMRECFSRGRLVFRKPLKLERIRLRPSWVGVEIGILGNDYLGGWLKSITSKTAHSAATKTICVSRQGLFTGSESASKDCGVSSLGLNYGRI